MRRMSALLSCLLFLSCLLACTETQPPTETSPEIHADSSGERPVELRFEPRSEPTKDAGKEPLPEPRPEPQTEPRPDLLPGQCWEDSDCKSFQICDRSLKKCFADCTAGAACFSGDYCNRKKRRCVCDETACKNEGGFCDTTEDRCKEGCKNDKDCPATARCLQGKCTTTLKEGENCEGGKSSLCAAGLLCLKTNQGGEICVLPCKADKDCKQGKVCAVGVLSDGRGLCGEAVGLGATCSTAQLRLCKPGLRCRNGRCEIQTRVGVFSQCDHAHLCTPSSMFCVGFGPDFGSICVNGCTVGKNECASDEVCSPSNGDPTKGVCFQKCNTEKDTCRHPYLRCLQTSGGLICAPQGKTTVNPVGGPCGGPYGSCTNGSTCQVVFAKQGIGICAKACNNGTCPQGQQCLDVAGKGKSCVVTCKGVGDACPTGQHCTQSKVGWLCAP